MSKGRLSAVSALVVAITLLVAGCMPRWSFNAGKYAVSDTLFDSIEPDKVNTKAADGSTFIIIGIDVAYNGIVPSSIESDLMFAIYENVDYRYDNFYEHEEWDYFDALPVMYKKGDVKSGSVFFHVPDDIDLNKCDFRVMLPDFTVLYSKSLSAMSRVSDYPGSW